jgi:hypothetical protein
MRWRVLLVLAFVTVLWGAPSIASAAGNTLAEPEATPTAGTILTPFTLRVSYSGSPAVSVSVSVAGRTIPMVLTGGSATQGSWSTTATLPEGNWPTTFRAETIQGRDPSINGPTINVDGLAFPTVPQATVVPVGLASPDEADEPEGAAPSSTEAPAAPAVPDAAPAGESPSATAQAPSSQGVNETAPAAPVSSAGAAGGAAPSQPGGTGSSPAGTSSPPRAGNEASARGDLPGTAHAGSASRVPSGSQYQAAGPDAGHQDPGVLPIAAGIGGVVAAALLGWVGLLASRRRRRSAETGSGAVDAPTIGSEGDRVDAALLRRTLRRAKVRIDEEDPILTSVGVGLTRAEDAAVRRARRPRRQPPA